MSTIYEGEYIDSNCSIKNWILSGCDDKDWAECIEIEEQRHDKLVSRFSLPVVVKEQIKPKEIIHAPNGETLIDMGQNMTGWLEIKIKHQKELIFLLIIVKSFKKETFIMETLEVDLNNSVINQMEKKPLFIHTLLIMVFVMHD